MYCTKIGEIGRAIPPLSPHYERDSGQVVMYHKNALRYIVSSQTLEFQKCSCGGMPPPP